MKEFGITISDALERVEARILDAPLLQYKDGAKESVIKGAWRADGQHFHTPGALNKWCIINLDERSVKNENMRCVVYSCRFFFNNTLFLTTN
jgi:hypothetical protein